MFAHLKLDENISGVDYVIGDVHGCYDKLMQKLENVQFDFVNDRLICSGDLIDRGNKSKDVLNLLDEKWFYSTLGNHEQMCIDAYRYDWAVDGYTQNGGLWFFNECANDQDCIVEKLMSIPLTIRFDVGNKKYMVIHARVPEDDSEHNNMLDSTMMANIDSTYLNDAIWNRHFSAPSGKQMVSGFDIVFVGHTPNKSPVYSGNYLDMDTGVVYGLSEDFVLYNTKIEDFV